MILPGKIAIKYEFSSWEHKSAASKQKFLSGEAVIQAVTRPTLGRYFEWHAIGATAGKKTLTGADLKALDIWLHLYRLDEVEAMLIKESNE